MNKQLSQWIENMWRQGAIDVGQRDDLKARLNDGEDFTTIVKDMDRFVQYMPAGYQKQWPQVRQDAGVRD